MRSTLALLLAATAALVVTAPASARPVKYAGKTSSGHKITFTVNKGRVHDLTAGLRRSCLSLQGGGFPLGGAEVFGFRGSVPFRPHNRFTFMEKPAFHPNEVTKNNDLWLKRRDARTISGRMRLQYSFLIPKFPIGTFTTYSCLGGATFRARAQA